MLTTCDRFQVPCGPVYAIDEIFEDPQYKARENIAFVKDERMGELAIPNVMPRLSDTPGRITGLGPSLGAHNEEIFAGRLGLSADQIRSLKEEGTI